MRTGYWISGTGHAGLILWVLFAGYFDRFDEPEFQVSDVSFISEAELAALSQPSPVEEPDAATAISEPEAPDASAAPETPAADTPPEITDAPETPDAAPAEDSPDVAALTPPEQPEIEEIPPDVITPPSTESLVIEAPVSATPTPRAAPRVAPNPIEQPEPDAEIADSLREAALPDEATETPVEEQDATTPEETGDVIETEANQEEVERSSAPETSLRPPSRPSRPAPEAEPEAVAESATEDTIAAAVEALVAEAATEETSPAPSAPTGPPMNFGEIDGFKVAVSRCWNVGAVATADLDVIVVTRVNFSPDGKPTGIELLESEGGTPEAINRMFGKARSAISRCGASGFPLPPEKYDQWQVLDLVFDPRGMRLR